jgi:hypothetical protein
MERGDLEAGGPGRVVITLDCLLADGMLTRRRRFQSVADYVNKMKIDRFSMSKVQLHFLRNQIRYELVCFGFDENFLELLEKRFDREGMHPITWFASYDHRADMRDTLTYRPDVIYVVEPTLQQAAYWGYRGITLADL